MGRNTNFPAVDKINKLTPGNIKSGLTIANVVGAYPSTQYPLIGADSNTADLPAFTSTTGGTSYEWFKSDGTRLTGSIQANATVTPAATPQTLTAGLYRSVTVSGDADLVASNITSGVNIFGVQGSVQIPAADQVLQGVNVGVSTTGTVTLPTAGDVRQGVQFGANLALLGGLNPGAGMPPSCNSDGATNCIAVTNYPAVDKINKLTAGNIKSGVTIASVTGAYPSTLYPLIGADGGVNDLPAFADTTGGASYEWFKSDGARLTGSIQANATVTPAATAQTLTAGLYRSVTVSGDADLVANKILSGTDIFGVLGTAQAKLADCASDGQIGCTTVAAFPAIDTSSTAHPPKILSGQSILGINGSYTSDFPDAANVRANDTVNGTAGTLSNCASDGASECVAGSAYKAANMTNVTAANIKSGVTIAGVTGDYPSASNPLPNASVTSDLVSLAATVAAGNYEWWDAAGARYTGSITDAGTITPTTGNQTFNTSLYRTFTVAGDADLVASNIKYTINIFNVAGNLAAAPADCTSNGATGCVTTASYKSADLSNLAVGNIKSGVNIAGVTGQYPSASYPLPSASATADLDTATFNAKIKSSADFEYWTSAGVYQSGSGDADIQDFNIKNGVSIFNTLGLYSAPPVSPAGLTATAASGTQINLSWSNVGASGYVLVAREGAAVSFVPVDGTTYTAGAQGSEQIVYVGSAMSASHTGLTTGTTYHYALYSYDSIKNYAGPVRTSKAPSSICGNLAGGTWVAVPGNSIYSTTDFCVQKYIPYNASNLPTSASGQLPWVSINQTDAKARCADLGSGYHLITNPEWMTVAANIANKPSNWSNGSVGSGTMAKGHSDNNPGSACAADMDDSKGWVQGSCAGQTQGALAFNQRRTQFLSNNEVIWDIGGNVYQWLDLYNNQSKPMQINEDREYIDLGNGTATWPRSAFVPLNSVQSWWNDSWSNVQSIGTFYPGYDGSGGALARGGTWGYEPRAGVFTANLSYAPALVATVVGFRCAYTPP